MDLDRTVGSRPLAHYMLPISSGDAATMGIGAMSEQRWQRIYDDMADAGIVERGDYWRKAFDLSFVGSGLALPPR